MNITGRLTRNAEVRTLSNEKQVVNFSVAVNDSYRNKQGERIEQTTYFDCSYWISPNVAKILTKGTLVELTGRVSTRPWTANNGELARYVWLKDKPTKNNLRKLVNKLIRSLRTL